MRTSQWRLLLTGEQSAFDNMAMDEAILRCVVAGKSSPTLRFYGWYPSAVSIGYFQGIEQEVDLEVCRKEGVDVVRRLTGGGAVYHDRAGEVTYALIAKVDYPGIPDNILQSYEMLCKALVIGFEILGIQAIFSPINDILVGNKKISGNAQTRRFGGILQHGTLLCDVNPQLMFSLLKVPNEKIRDKLIQGIAERVTSIKRELGAVDKATIIQAMITGFKKAMHIELVEGTLSDEEIALTTNLKVEKYGTEAWNHKR
ncbi:MAG: lipoate--protein ligase family protein [Anaerolineae bacterium]|nr:lipoate--protein ligase family protein [Anaerolineae bacterium]